MRGGVPGVGRLYIRLVLLLQLHGAPPDLRRGGGRGPGHDIHGRQCDGWPVLLQAAQPRHGDLHLRLGGRDLHIFPASLCADLPVRVEGQHPGDGRLLPPLLPPGPRHGAQHKTSSGQGTREQTTEVDRPDNFARHPFCPLYCLQYPHDDGCVLHIPLPTSGKWPFRFFFLLTSISYLSVGRSQGPVPGPGLVPHLNARDHQHPWPGAQRLGLRHPMRQSSRGILRRSDLK